MCATGGVMRTTVEPMDCSAIVAVGIGPNVAACMDAKPAAAAAVD